MLSSTNLLRSLHVEGATTWLLPHGAKCQNVRVLRALDFVLSLWRANFFFWTCVQAAIVSRVAIATTQAVAYRQMMPPVTHSQACLKYDGVAPAAAAPAATASGGVATAATTRRRSGGGVAAAFDG